MKTYFTLFLRLLQKNRLFAFINLAGLTAGMVCVTLIFMFICDEVSYDKHIPGSDRIYRVAWFNDNPQTRTPHPMAQALVHDFPEVESAVSLSPLWGPGLTRQTFEVKNLERDIHFNEAGVLSVDSTFFEVFPFQLVKGNAKKVLRTPGKLLISESSAQRYFGNEDPIGKRLAVDQDRNVLEIEGVFKDVPANTHFHFDFLVSYVTMKAGAGSGSEYYTWHDFGHFNYIRLREGASAQQLEAQLMDWVRKYIVISDADFKQMMAQQEHFSLQPVEDIHLRSNIRWELEANGNIEYVYILGGAALFILVIACLNFISLSTAKSVDRAKEIGVRKTLGAGKRQLYSQFLGESLMLSLSASILAIGLVQLLLPLFHSLTQKQMPLQPLGIFFIIGTGLVIGLISGFYPAFHLSSLKPQSVLKGKFSSSRGGRFLQNSMVVSQFSLAMILICGCFVLVQQLLYLKNKPLGFDKEQVVVIPFRMDFLKSDFKTVKEELTKIPGVRGITATSNIPGKQYNQQPMIWTGDLNHDIDASEAFADEDFAATLGIKLVAGRFFDSDSKADSADAIVINEAAAQQLGMPDPVGQRIRIERDGEWWERTVTGVVENFHFQSLHNAIQPLFMLPRERFNFALLKIDASQTGETMAEVKDVWPKLSNSFGFDYFFLDETVNRQYQAEQRMSLVLIFFTGTGILITCMGLLGLAIVNFKAREKEVGVRKVLGSSTLGIQALLLKDMGQLVLVALAIGSPLAYLFVRSWLQNFVYHVNLSVWNFAAAGLMVILISLLTVSYLVRKTSGLNPTEVLKQE